MVMHLPKLSFSYITRRFRTMAASATPGSPVLVTGVNGHVASATALRLLQKGYKVRGTVRSLKRGAFIQNEFKSFGDSFELVEVPDIVAPGAFDEALKGMCRIFDNGVSANSSLQKLAPSSIWLRP